MVTRESTAPMMILSKKLRPFYGPCAGVHTPAKRCVATK
jgi:hypothetical protein